MGGMLLMMGVWFVIGSMVALMIGRFLHVQHPERRHHEDDEA